MVRYIVSQSATLRIERPPAQNVPVTGVECTVSKDRIVVGEKVQIIAKVLPENATNKRVSWYSFEEGIATVDSNGWVTGIGEGYSWVRVTTEDGSKIADTLINVSQTLLGV